MRQLSIYARSSKPPAGGARDPLGPAASINAPEGVRLVLWPDGPRHVGVRGKAREPLVKKPRQHQKLPLPSDGVFPLGGGVGPDPAQSPIHRSTPGIDRASAAVAATSPRDPAPPLRQLRGG